MCVCFVSPKEALLEEVCADVAPFQVAHLTAGPDLLQAPDPRTGDIGGLLGLHHDDQAGVHRDWRRGRDETQLRARDRLACLHLRPGSNTIG